MAAKLSEDAKSATWISPGEVARRLEVPITTVRQMMRSQAVTCRRLPNARPTILAADVERIAAQSIIKAR